MTNEILKDEILSDDQLDQVAGGSWGESVGDYLNAFDRKIPGFDKIDPKSADGAIYLLQNWTEGDNVVGKLEKMFASHGITMTYSSVFGDIVGTSKANQYSINGKQVSRDDAWKHINAQFGN